VENWIEIFLFSLSQKEKDLRDFTASLFEALCLSKFFKGYKEVWNSPPLIGKNDVDNKK